MKGRRFSGSSPSLCLPRYATPRSPDRPTLGPRVGQVAAALRKPLMWHQQQIADVALELDPQTGLLAYREVVVVMMRQNGKSELILPVITHRSMSWPEQRSVYTTNTSAKARERWEDIHLKRLKASPFKSMFTERLRLAQEAILWNNGSTYSPISTTAKTGGTGDSVDLGVIDEAWVHEDSGLEQALRPTMLTREQPQLWLLSMVPGPTRAKTITSAFLRRKMALGRARVRAGLQSDMCYVEFSAEDGLDPGDPATWWSCMPALGHTIGEAAVRSDFDAMELADFTTEYLSWWPDEASQGWKVIGEGEWELARDPDSVPLDPVAIAVDVLPDRSWAAIGAAGKRLDGLRHVEVTGRQDDPDYRPGAGWVVPRLQQIVQAHQPCVVAINDRATADAAEAAGLQIHRMSVPEVASACGVFFEAVAGQDVATRRLRHPDDGVLDQAAKDAVKRKVGVGGGWAWQHNCVLTAVSMALAALERPQIHIKQRRPAAAFVPHGATKRKTAQYDEQGNRVIRMGGGVQ